MKHLIRNLSYGAAVSGLVVACFLFASAAYTVDQAEQAIILQFGKPVGSVITEPGLHFRMPFIQEVRRFDKRLLAWDGDPNQIPTRGREFISVDTTARWRIVDPLQFLKSVKDENGAQSRLDDIIDSVVRDQISSSELTDIVRSKDWEVTEKDLQELDSLDNGETAEKLADKPRIGRKVLTRNILREAQRGMPEKYGIELVDVRIKRINYIPSVRKQVFDRMISERQRIAEQFRSEGQGEASKIEGETSLELASIRSEAKRKAEIIRGEADAEATRVYNQAYSADTAFYHFMRTLESYPQTLGKTTTMILSSDNDYLQFIRSIETE
jgi:membrane protease subunit HflC